MLRLAAPIDVLRGGGSMEPKISFSAMGDTAVGSTKLGVDEHVRPDVATLPKRNGGSGVSALCGRWWILFAEKPFVRVSDGRVAGRLRLMIVSID